MHVNVFYPNDMFYLCLRGLYGVFSEYSEYIIYKGITTRLIVEHVLQRFGWGEYLMNE